MASLRDRKYLVALSELVIERLGQNHLGKPFILNRKPEIRKTYSDGWNAIVGRVGGYDCRAEVWLDRFSGHSQRKVYYGIHSWKIEHVKDVVKHVKKDMGEHLIVTNENVTKQNGFTKILKKLAKAKFGYPILEIYEKTTEDYEEGMYGLYELNKTGLQQNEVDRLVERIEDFIRTIVESLPESEKAKQDNLNYAGIENRKAVVSHIHRERKGHLATLRKQHDNCICQICSFNYQDIYGKLGANFAEAHHRIPLNKLSKKTNTKIEDLITVCSNCHRMLHRMNGDKGDINRLKKIIKSHM